VSPAAVSEIETASRVGLRRTLTVPEIYLLDIVFEQLFTQSKRWPTWIYVSRKMYKDHQLDALSVWRGLPKLMNVPNSYGGTSEYGLLWRADANSANIGSSEPMLGERIGLSIAGLLALSYGMKGARELADWAVNVGRAMGQSEIDIPLNPEQSEIVPIDTIHWHAGLSILTYLIPGLPPETAWTMFQKEPLMPTLTDYGPLSDHHWTVTVFPKDRRLAQIQSPDEYLDLVEAETRLREPLPQFVEPFDLIRAFDFMAMSLSQSFRWEQPLSTSRLLPVARLLEPVTTSEELSDRLSALTNIIDCINAPIIPAEKPGANEHHGSIARLNYWLVRKHGLRVGEAIRTLQAINRVRVNFQHAGSDRDDQKHYQFLHLDMPLTQWAESWNLIMAQATRAIYSIADAVVNAASEDDDSV
jgi:hypothetical protein